MKGDDVNDADMAALNKAGPLGLFLVVLGLVWWGERQEEIGRRYEGPGGWLAGVNEVRRVLSDLRDDHMEIENASPSNSSK